ncbi:MAG: PEP-CTERM sorting domain-containing protein [Acidobacteria bacterium]|nr:PEP-CTERM sorting domain-containing protein [Acidobacteriota bacterium]
MSRRLRCVAGAAALGLVTMAGYGIAEASTISVHVYSALAPNAFGSPNWAAWEANAVTAMENGGAATAGAPGTPAFFEQRTSVTTAEAVVTGFPSWLGQVDPGTVYGPAYANEYGNRITFPLWIDGGGSQFSISQLGFSATSTDPFNALGFSFAPGGYNYTTAYVGLDYGTDGIKGTGDDAWITSGANTQLVNELFGRGSGNSFAAYCPGCSLADQQAAINDVAAYPGSDFTFTGTYYLEENTRRLAEGSAVLAVTPVPEPASMLLLATGLVGTVRAARKSRERRK